MNRTAYDPEGATVLWDVVNGTRVDRIIAVDTHHAVTIRRLTMVRHHLKIEDCENLHSHCFWHELPRDRAAQLADGARYGIVGHTVFDIEPAANIHKHWAAAHDYAAHRFGFVSAETMVQARDLVEACPMVQAVSKAWHSSDMRRVTHADLVVPE